MRFPENNKNYWFGKEVHFKVKWQNKMQKSQFVTLTSLCQKSDLVRI